MNAFFIALSALLISIPICTSRNLPKGKLVGVTVIFRHGDRTPLDTYPKDPYKDPAFWPQGMGQLTNKGKLQEYYLGEWFRKRYDGFLSREYIESEVYVRSTDMDRTLMSAESNLAGLYPPVGKQVWLKPIKWQPIPVHTIPLDYDTELYMFTPCELFDHLKSNLEKTPEFVNFYKNIEGLVAYLTEHTGLSIKTITDVFNIYDILQIEVDQNFTLPAWTKSVFPEKMEPFAKLFFALSCYTPKMARLVAGPFFHLLVKGFTDIVEKVPNTRKFKMYSSHDSTLGSILTALNAYEYIRPPYASSLMFEMRSVKEEFFINLFYKNSTIAYPITINGCEFDCPFEKFVQIIEPITISLAERNEECQIVH